ncbi:hypothetical protein PQ478_08655 [Alkalihalophilus pseudofirmus]|uniref:hypothetical protein n=1 Tax=Alkalihalophilus pseudofirmus TaxID=79885 RepID=UPI00259B9B5E|nr:hypothetical protein [Alkalihalophilus pseudofirmus]WEG18539.1 hypothetical protein PQ478_08655 [Alkalihalophilus pseudofirmus]
MNLSTLSNQLKAGEKIGKRIESIQYTNNCYVWSVRGFNDVIIHDYKEALDVARMLTEA